MYIYSHSSFSLFSFFLIIKNIVHPFCLSAIPRADNKFLILSLSLLYITLLYNTVNCHACLIVIHFKMLITVNAHPIGFIVSNKVMKLQHVWLIVSLTFMEYTKEIFSPQQPDFL